MIQPKHPTSPQYKDYTRDHFDSNPGHPCVVLHCCVFVHVNPLASNCTSSYYVSCKFLLISPHTTQAWPHLDSKQCVILLFIHFWSRWVFAAALRLSLVVVSGATLRCATQASHSGGFSCCGVHALGAWASLVVTHGLLFARDTWTLPGPGIEPMSSALAGGFLATVPPGKSHTLFYTLYSVLTSAMGLHTLLQCFCVLLFPTKCKPLVDQKCLFHFPYSQ